MSSIMAFSFLVCFDSSFLLFPMPCALNFFCPHFLSSQQQRNHNLCSVRPTVKKRKKETSNIYFLPENHQLFLACSNSLFLSLLLHAPFPPVDQKLTIPGSTNSFECPGERERERGKKISNNYCSVVNSSFTQGIVATSLLVPASGLVA